MGENARQAPRSLQKACSDPAPAVSSRDRQQLQPVASNEATSAAADVRNFLFTEDDFVPLRVLHRRHMRNRRARRCRCAPPVTETGGTQNEACFARGIIRVPPCPVAAVWQPPRTPCSSPFQGRWLARSPRNADGLARIPPPARRRSRRTTRETQLRQRPHDRQHLLLDARSYFSRSMEKHCLIPRTLSNAMRHATLVSKYAAREGRQVTRIARILRSWRLRFGGVHIGPESGLHS
jgi:hypothetical protein